MTKLHAQDFSRFFAVVNGVAPFPWQLRLIDQLEAKKCWPLGLTLPTGSGKTSAIDIAVFSLACDLANNQRRAMPTRIVFVVDRRIIVDAAYDRALKLSRAIRDATDPIVRAVRDALASVAIAGFQVLHVERLRGGAPRERDWTPSPSHPTVLLSTVDQVGSRLLFRGYGVSESMRPVHAGLLGTDAVMLIDEVHLSEPFRQTLRSVEQVRNSTHLPWAVVELSATPRGAGTDVFELNGDDRAHPVLRARLAATKSAALVDAHEDDLEELAARFVREAIARSIVGEGLHRRILVIVNRVALARLIYDRLRAQLDAEAIGDVDLLIGRSREIDANLRRANIIERTGTRSNNTSAVDERPYFLVATQTIEAGADVDFDALISQIASLDALRQRFGRVDRVGHLAQCGSFSHSAIIATRQEVSKGDPDPIYGEALRATWQWLRENADAKIEVDFGIDAMDARVKNINSQLLVQLSSPQVDAPTLMPSYVRILEETRPTPKPDLAIDLFLHGPNMEPADVSIVWRGDIPAPGTFAEERVAAILDAVPPRAAEAIALPIWVVRRWLRERQTGRRPTRASADIGDISGRHDERNDAMQLGSTPVAWRWDGDENAKAILPSQVRPGDMLVVPTSYGGCDEFGWAPQSDEPVFDVADAAARPYIRSSFAVRLHPGLLRNEIARDGRLARDERFEDRARQAWRSLLGSIGSEIDPREIVERAVDSAVLPVNGSTRSSLELLLDRLQEKNGGGVRILASFPYGSESADRGAGIIIVAPRGLPVERMKQEDDDSLDATTEIDERAVLADGRYFLLDHSEDVERYARATAAHLRLPPDLVDDIALAGWFHDAGKSDFRFQRYLIGSRWLTETQLLAKSLESRDRNADRRAKNVAVLPDRWRHEALSVRVARSHPRFQQANDPELVLWMIGVHHGWGRPLFPHDDPLDGHPREIEAVDGTLLLGEDRAPHAPEFALPIIDQDGIVEVSWPALGRRLALRYGSWDLALLETVVRLADHRASAARSRAGAR